MRVFVRRYHPDFLVALMPLPLGVAAERFSL
jgi:hypothetical protein